MKNDDIHVPLTTFSRERTSISPLASPNRRSEEKLLIAYVSHGNPILLQEHMENNITKAKRNAVQLLSTLSLTQAKYEGSALVTRARRAAAEAGVPSEVTQSISDACLLEYDAMTTPSVLWNLVQKTLLQFCEAVNEVNLSQFSGAVRQCCEYIHANLCSSISLDELGQVCHLSPHYVSDIFRKDLGIGALQYAHQVKMQYAKFLLEHTDKGIAEISASLSYPSHSNFSQRFKKIYGITPHEFRVSHGR